MNILREVRRVKEKSIWARIGLILTFSVILIINTYAWFSTQRNIHLGGLVGDVTAWDVFYYVNSDKNEILDQTATFTIDELYPGMPDRQDVVHIHNMGEASTNIKYELISVKVFGQEVLSELEIDQNTSTVTIFSKDKGYPFNITYTYDRTKLIGTYVEDDESTPDVVESNPTASATFKLNVNWAYEVNDDPTTEGINESEAKDVLDTKFGKDAYAYYQKEDSDPTKAIEINVKITSSMIHPDDDPDYPS